MSIKATFGTIKYVHSFSKFVDGYYRENHLLKQQTLFQGQIDSDVMSLEEMQKLYTKTKREISDINYSQKLKSGYKL